MSSRWSSYKPNDRPSAQSPPLDAHGYDSFMALAELDDKAKQFSRSTQDLLYKRDRTDDRSPPAPGGIRDHRDASFRGRRDFRTPPEGPSSHANHAHGRPFLSRPHSYSQGSGHERSFRRSPPPHEPAVHHSLAGPNRYAQGNGVSPTVRHQRSWSPEAPRWPDSTRRQTSGPPRGLTAADRDRLAREREAREYKANQQWHGREGHLSHTRRASTPVKFESRERDNGPLRISGPPFNKPNGLSRSHTAPTSPAGQAENVRQILPDASTSDSKVHKAAERSIDIIIDLLTSPSPREPLAVDTAGQRNVEANVGVFSQSLKEDTQRPMNTSAVQTSPTSLPVLANSQAEEDYVNPFDAMDDEDDEDAEMAEPEPAVNLLNSKPETVDRSTARPPVQQNQRAATPLTDMKREDSIPAEAPQKSATVEDSVVNDNRATLMDESRQEVPIALTPDQTRANETLTAAQDSVDHLKQESPILDGPKASSMGDGQVVRPRSLSAGSQASTVHLEDSQMEQVASPNIEEDSIAELQAEHVAKSSDAQRSSEKDQFLREATHDSGIEANEVDVDTEVGPVSATFQQRERLEERIRDLADETLALKTAVSESDDRHQALREHYNVLQSDLEDLLALLEAPLPRRKQYCQKFDKSLAGQVLEQNLSQCLTRKKVDRRRLFGEPQEHDFYQYNLALFKKSKAGVTAILARHRRENAECIEALRSEFEERQAGWKATTAKYDHQRWYQMQQEEATTAVAPGASASSRGTRGRPIGYEIKEAFHGLILPSNVLNEASIPALISDPFERELCYLDDQNAKVEEPLEYYKIGRPTATDYWTAEEQNIFIARFKATPKQFGAIAAGLPGRTAEDCVLHYYKSKAGIEYKTGKPRTKYAPKRGRPSRRGQTRSYKRSIVASQDDGEEGEDEEVEAVVAKRRRRTTAVEGDDAVKRVRPLRRPRRQLDDIVAELTDETRESSPAVSSLGQTPQRTEVLAAPQAPREGPQFPTAQARIPQADPNNRPFAWTDQDEAQFIVLLKRYGSDFSAITSWMPGKSLAQVQRHFDDYLVERNYRQYLPRSGGPAALSEPRNDPPAFGYGSNKQSYSHYSQQQHAPVQPQQVPSGPSHGGGSYRPQPMLSVQGPGQYTSPYSAYNQGPPAPPQNQPMFPYGRPPEGPGGYMSMGAHPFGQAPQQSSYDYRGGPGGPPQHPSFHMHPQQLHHPHHPSMQSMPSQYGNQRGSFDMRHDRSGPPNIPLGPSDKSDRPLSRNSIDSILNGNPHPRDLPPVHRGGYPVNQNNRMGDGYPPHSQGYHNNGPRGPYYYPHQR